MKGQRGVTLVEVVVTGILASVVAGAALSTIYMNTSQIRDGSSMLELARIYDAAVYRIGWRVREAAAVLGDGEAFAGKNALTASDTVQSIFLYDADGALTGGFRIAAGQLEELLGADWTVMREGPDPISLDPASLGFFLQSRRRALGLGLRMAKTEEAVEYILTSRGDYFRCRNAE